MDKFINAFKEAVLENYANFAGRLSVSKYWHYFAVNFAILVVLAILSRVAGVFAIVYLVYALATLLPSLGAGIRRLHDTGKSGWFILVGVIPIVGWILLIVWLAAAGDSNVNEYGPPPVA